jgi:type I restriction enzyme S subunit
MKGMNIARAVARVPADPARVNPVFLLFYLKTPFVQHYFQSQVRTVNQPTLNIKQINETPVYVPARSLQDNFANRAMKVLEIREMLVSTDGKIETLFSGIQHMAFRGEL